MVTIKIDSPFPAAPKTLAITNARIIFKMVLQILVNRVLIKREEIIYMQNYKICFENGRWSCSQQTKNLRVWKINMEIYLFFHQEKVTSY